LERTDETEGEATGKRDGGPVSFEAKNIINLRHELVRLGELLDWARLEAHFGAVLQGSGTSGLPIRLVVGLHLLKHVEGLSDEAVCARWERDPYMQYFAGRNIFSTRFRWSVRG